MWTFNRVVVALVPRLESKKDALKIMLSRTRAIAEAAKRVFGHVNVAPGVTVRTGRKILRRKLKGDTILNWYGPRFVPRDLDEKVGYVLSPSYIANVLLFFFNFYFTAKLPCFYYLYSAFFFFFFFFFF